MVSNLLKKNDLGMNEVVKQTALATRTRARNVSLNKFRWNKSYLLGFVDSHLIHYPTPIGLTYAWSFGSLAGMCLVIQILSGILLTTHYTANIDLAAYLHRCRLGLVRGKTHLKGVLMLRQHF